MRRRLKLGELGQLLKLQQDGPPEAYHEYVRQLHEEEGVTYQAIATELGTSRQWVFKITKKAQRALTQEAKKDEDGIGTDVV